MKYTLLSFLLLGCIGEDQEVAALRRQITEMTVKQRMTTHRKLCDDYQGFSYTNVDNVYCDLYLKNGMTVTLRNGQIIGD